MTDFNSFYNAILKSFARYPVMIYGDRRITYGEFDEQTNRLAHALLELGIERADVREWSLWRGPSRGNLFRPFRHGRCSVFVGGVRLRRAATRW